jgi:hypothetical protein
MSCSPTFLIHTNNKDQPKFQKETAVLVKLIDESGTLGVLTVTLCTHTHTQTRAHEQVTAKTV